MDNYLYIDKKNRVWDCVASCICSHKKHHLACQKYNIVKECKDLEEAFKIANKQENEYGVTNYLWCK